MIDERTVDITASFLGRVDSSEEVREWIVENRYDFQQYMTEYDLLIKEFNRIPENAPILQQLPKARKLKELMNKEPLPTLDQMADGNFANALFASRKLILAGQNYAKGEVMPTQGQKDLAIGTPSYRTSPEARAVGTAAHLAERTFFEWADKNGIREKSKWKKDEWLHGLKDILLLLETKGTPLRLTELFLKPNNKDGLGWLTQDILDDARRRLETYIFDI
jgi:hypothetical protein